jgi:hypothetical protein
LIVSEAAALAGYEQQRQRHLMIAAPDEAAPSGIDIQFEPVLLHVKYRKVS